MNIKTLSLIVLILGGIYGAIYFLDLNKNESTISIENLEIDTAAIDVIRFKPELTNRQELILTRTEEGWKVGNSDKEFKADAQSIEVMLRELKNLRINRMAGTKAEAWAKFELTDSAGTPVSIESNGKTMLSMVVGNFDFDQQTQQPLTYIRFNNDQKSWLVNGYLPGLFNRDLASYRNKMLTRFESSQINKVTFTYPGDSSFVLSKNNGIWFRNMQAIDSLACKNYIAGLGKISSPGIIEENINLQSLPVSHTIKIEGDSIGTIEIKAYAGHPLYPVILSSSMNQECLFKADANKTFEQYFVSPRKFDIN